MKLGEANRVFEQVRQAMVSGECIKLSSVGNGTHARKDIAMAINLIVAGEYWHRTLTKEQLDQWQEFLEAANSAISRVMLGSLIIPDEHFIDTSHLEKGSHEYNRALSDMSLAGYEAVRNAKDNKFRIEEPSSLARFFATLDVWKPKQYWKAVYNRLELSFPEHDPDRFEPDRDANIGRILAGNTLKSNSAKERNSNPLTPEQANEARAKRDSEIKLNVLAIVKLFGFSIACGLCLAFCLRK